MSALIYRPDLRIGILGGGQLGQMLLQAAVPFGFTMKVLDPDPSAPAAALTRHFTQGSFALAADVEAFARACDLVTVEIEHVAAEALAEVERHGVRVHPRPSILQLVQDKGAQKSFYKKHGIPTADFTLVEGREEARTKAALLPAFQKLRRHGYDGRGVKRLATPADLDAAFDAPSVLEAAVEGAREISILLARNTHGEIAVYPPVEMVFHPRTHMLDHLIAPAAVGAREFHQAAKIARATAEALDHVGLLAVEMFRTADGQYLVNEIAPRPHNSGHHTIQANATSQYENHLRAVAGLPLGSTESLRMSAVVNLVGAEGHEGPAVYEGLSDVLALRGASVHLYRKKTTRPWRKMGHVTILDTNAARLREKIDFVKRTVRVLAGEPT